MWHLTAINCSTALSRPASLASRASLQRVFLAAAASNGTLDTRGISARDSEEHDIARTQEFVLRWSADGGRTYREVVRQQYTFSPPGTTQEIEDYVVEFDGITAVELRIVADMSGGPARASLSEWMRARAVSGSAAAV